MGGFWAMSGRRAMVVATIAAAVVFATDLSTPGGVALGVLYVVVVASGVLASGSWPVVASGAACSGLSILALLFKEPVAGVGWWVVAANRALTLVAIWTVAGLVVAARRRQEAARLADEERRRATSTLELAMAQMPDGILLVERSGRIESANPAADRIFGWEPGQLAGRPVEDLVPAALRRKHAEHRDTFATEPQVRPMGKGRELRSLRKDGKEVWIDVALAPATDGRVIVSVRDVSEARRFDERRRAAQRLEAIGRLAGGVAHDFNNLLAVIVSCSEFLRRVAVEEPHRTDLEDIRDAARRASELTKQLLAFSRQQIISPRRLDANALASEMRKMLSRILGEDIELDTQLASGLWSVVIDPSQLEQIFLNLVVNARDAMPEGGKLTIETANVTLDAAYVREHPDVAQGEHVMLAVSDTGTGMTEEVRVRVFEPFFSTKPTNTGTGLGLATVYGIVKQAGGHIWVYSEPGQGTTFKVYLPRAQGEPEKLPARESARPRGGTETVLVVEDDPPVRRVIVRTLRGAGYEVVEASNGLDALHKLESLGQHVALVVTDVVMPQMGGRALADRIRETKPDLRVLFLSGYTENAIVHRGVLDADLVFLQKPFAAADLLRRVRELLDAR